jgi:GNAT superfamily N-acetyltransferase
VVEIRPAAANDLDAIKWALYESLAWSSGLPPAELVLRHPQAERYHRDWGRPGDLGVIATLGDELVGVAYCRLFTEEDHGHGYVDDRTPEIAIAVRDGHRGQGIGGTLLRALADLARAKGFSRLSLSTDLANPARRLYERVGYREISVDPQGVRMLIELGSEPPLPSRG